MNTTEQISEENEQLALDLDEVYEFEGAFDEEGEIIVEDEIILDGYWDS